MRFKKRPQYFSESQTSLSSQGIGLTYESIRTNRKEYSVVRLRDALEDSTSGFYDWLDRPDSFKNTNSKLLTEKIKVLHATPRGMCASPKIHADLVPEGHSCSVNRVARLMQEAAMESKLSGKIIVTTDYTKKSMPACNLSVFSL